MSKKADALGQYPIPNVRKLIIPDPGFELASIDLTGADAQTVAWESNDTELKRVFRENKIKIHAHNAKMMWPQLCPTGFEQPYYDLIRTGVHLVNYVGGVDTLAAAMGVPKWEANAFIDKWFSLHPNILDWHERVMDQLQRTRQVQNAFGYRRFYFDRIEGMLPEAVAWIGQSTTACVTNRALVRAESFDRGQFVRDLQIQFLLQVHDELVFQYPVIYRTEVLRKIKPLVHVTVPYDDPLIIPWGLKTSLKSWGECEKRQWPSECQTNAIMTTG